MDDIVARLRQFGDSCGLDAEAADEIERLREALQLAVGELSTQKFYRLWSPDALYEQFLDKTFLDKSETGLK